MNQKEALNRQDRTWHERKPEHILLKRYKKKKPSEKLRRDEKNEPI